MRPVVGGRGERREAKLDSDGECII